MSARLGNAWSIQVWLNEVIAVLMPINSTLKTFLQFSAIFQSLNIGHLLLQLCRCFQLLYHFEFVITCDPEWETDNFIQSSRRAINSHDPGHLVAWCKQYNNRRIGTGIY